MILVPLPPKSIAIKTLTFLFLPMRVPRPCFLRFCSQDELYCQSQNYGKIWDKLGKFGAILGKLTLFDRFLSRLHSHFFPLFPDLPHPKAVTVSISKAIPISYCHHIELFIPLLLTSDTYKSKQWWDVHLCVRIKSSATTACWGTPPKPPGERVAKRNENSRNWENARLFLDVDSTLLKLSMNKKKAKLQPQLCVGSVCANAIADNAQMLTKGKARTSKQIQRRAAKRNNQVDSYLHKSYRLIINELIKARIATLVIGKNELWKQGIEIGRVNNSSFVSIPHARFVEMLA